MKSLFSEKDVNGFIERINKLTPESKALWGKMNVAQMLAHCEVPLSMAQGEMRAKVNPIIKFLFAKRAKKEILYGKGLGKNSPTMNEAKIVDKREFEEEKQKLIKKIRSFFEKGKAGITREPHPFFGELSIEEWDQLQSKHLDHHLSQFGV
jgi:hypothetical protein